MKPEQAGIHSKYIKQYIEKLEKKHLAMHNMLIAKGDDILFETYWEPFHAEYNHRMYSVSKSIVAIAIGFLEQDGKISLDDYVGDYFPEEIENSSDEYLRKTTIKHMLMMSTARAPKKGGWWFGTEDRVKYYFEDSDVVSRPSGTIWDYDSTGSFILGALVERVSGMKFMDYLREKLFDKIGVSKGAYCLECPGGHSWGDSAVLCTQRDLFKIARFVMNKGKWNGEQILNEAYLTAAASKLIDNNMRDIKAWDSYGYGYQIWQTFQNSFLFFGMGCQIALGIPEKDLIFICNGDAQGNEYGMQIVLENFFEIIADNMESSPIAEEGGYDELMQTTKHLKLATAIGEKQSGLESKIHGVTYEMDDNPMGITKMRFEFDKDGGTWYYTNAQGHKELRFGRCENIFGDFPEEGYSDMIGGQVAPGHKYHCATSAAWSSETELYIKVQIIDKYFGNLTVRVGFRDDVIGVSMHKVAEAFLETYQGFAGGRAI